MQWELGWCDHGMPLGESGIELNLEDYSRFPQADLVKRKKKGEAGLCKENSMSKSREAGKRKTCLEKIREVQFDQEISGRWLSEVVKYMSLGVRKM